MSGSALATECGLPTNSTTDLGWPQMMDAVEVNRLWCAQLDHTQTNTSDETISSNNDVEFGKLQQELSIIPVSYTYTVTTCYYALWDS